ncbi:unnamed protein product [Gadus morhua 'NCC']
MSEGQFLSMLHFRGEGVPAAYWGPACSSRGSKFSALLHAGAAAARQGIGARPTCCLLDGPADNPGDNDWGGDGGDEGRWGEGQALGDEWLAAGATIHPLSP